MLKIKVHLCKKIILTKHLFIIFQNLLKLEIKIYFILALMLFIPLRGLVSLMLI